MLWALATSFTHLTNESTVDPRGAAAADLRRTRDRRRGHEQHPAAAARSPTSPKTSRTRCSPSTPTPATALCRSRSSSRAVASLLGLANSFRMRRLPDIKPAAALEGLDPRVRQVSCHPYGRVRSRRWPGRTCRGGRGRRRSRPGHRIGSARTPRDRPGAPAHGPAYRGRGVPRTHPAAHRSAPAGELTRPRRFSWCFDHHRTVGHVQHLPSGLTIAV